MPTDVPRITVLLGESLTRVVNDRANRYKRSRVREIEYLCGLAISDLGEDDLEDKVDETWLNDCPNSGRCNVYEATAVKARTKMADPNTSFSESVRRLVHHGLIVVKEEHE